MRNLNQTLTNKIERIEQGRKRSINFNPAHKREIEQDIFYTKTAIEGITEEIKVPKTQLYKLISTGLIIKVTLV